MIARSRLGNKTSERLVGLLGEIAVQRANLEFDMLMQVRNKVVSAYQEIMKMQM